MKRVGFVPGTNTPKHGTALEDLAFLTECTLATVEDLEMKSKPPKGELNRQRRIALFGVDALLFHGDGNDAREAGCTRVQAIIDHYFEGGELKMPWED